MYIQFFTRGRFWIRAIAVIIISCFVNQDIVWARGEVPQSSISIPKDAAITKEIYQAAGNKTIINIQDAHSSLSAQESITSILDNLVANYDLKLVAVEGSSGYIDTSLLRTMPDDSMKKEFARSLMEQGRMSAGEFFSITSGEKIALYGIDDKQLYDRNVEEFRRAYELGRPMKEGVAGLVKALDALKSKIYSDELKTIFANEALHAAGKITLKDRWGYVSSLARKHGMGSSAFPNLARLALSFETEKSIDFEKANSEREALIDVLGRTAGKADLEKLVMKSLAFKTGRIAKTEFYLFLKDLARRNSIDPAPYINLIAFTGYIAIYESIDLIGLMEEAKRFEGEVENRLFANEDQRRLHDLIDLTGLVRDLFGMKLSNDGLSALEASLRTQSASSIAGFMRDMSAKYGVPLDGGYDLGAIYENMPAAMDFYRTAEARNAAMLSNTIKRMDEEGRSVAALVTGGYHTRGISELLRQRQASYIVILPRFDASKPERPYVAILTNKKAPYEGMLKSGTHYLAVGAYNDPSLPEETRLKVLKEDLMPLLRDRIKGAKDPDKAAIRFLKKWEKKNKAEYDTYHTGMPPEIVKPFLDKLRSEVLRKKQKPARRKEELRPAMPAGTREADKKETLVNRLVSDLEGKDIFAFHEIYPKMCGRLKISAQEAAEMKNEVRVEVARRLKERLAAVPAAGPQGGGDLKDEKAKAAAVRKIVSYLIENVDLALKGSNRTLTVRRMIGEMKWHVAKLESAREAKNSANELVNLIPSLSALVAEAGRDDFFRLAQNIGSGALTKEDTEFLWEALGDRVDNAISGLRSAEYAAEMPKGSPQRGKMIEMCRGCIARLEERLGGLAGLERFEPYSKGVAVKDLRYDNKPLAVPIEVVAPPARTAKAAPSFIKRLGKGVSGIIFALVLFIYGMQPAYAGDGAGQAPAAAAAVSAKDKKAELIRRQIKIYDEAIKALYPGISDGELSNRKALYRATWYHETDGGNAMEQYGGPAVGPGIEPDTAVDIVRFIKSQPPAKRARLIAFVNAALGGKWGEIAALKGQALSERLARDIVSNPRFAAYLMVIRYMYGVRMEVPRDRLEFFNKDGSINEAALRTLAELWQKNYQRSTDPEVAEERIESFMAHARILFGSLRDIEARKQVTRPVQKSEVEVKVEVETKVEDETGESLSVPANPRTSILIIFFAIVGVALHFFISLFTPVFGRREPAVRFFQAFIARKEKDYFDEKHFVVNGRRYEKTDTEKIKADLITCYDLDKFGPAAGFNFDMHKRLLEALERFNIDKDMLAVLINEAVTESLKSGIRGPDAFKEVSGEAIIIALLDKSESIFEDGWRNGFIGINRILFEKIAEALPYRNKRPALEVFLVVGITHELRHESGVTDEDLLAAEDARLTAALCRKRHINPRSLIEALETVAEEGKFAVALKALHREIASAKVEAMIEAKAKVEVKPAPDKYMRTKELLKDLEEKPWSESYLKAREELNRMISTSRDLEYLIWCLDHVNKPEFMATAIEALRKTDIPADLIEGAVKALIKRINSDKDDAPVRMAALKTLGNMRVPMRLVKRTTMAIVRVLKNKKDRADVRACASDVLRDELDIPGNVELKKLRLMVREACDKADKELRTRNQPVSEQDNIPRFLDLKEYEKPIWEEVKKLVSKNAEVRKEGEKNLLVMCGDPANGETTLRFLETRAMPRCADDEYCLLQTGIIDVKLRAKELQPKRRPRGSAAECLSTITGDEGLLGLALTKGFYFKRDLLPKRLNSNEIPFSERTVKHREVAALKDLGILISTDDGRIKFSDMMIGPDNRGPPDPRYTINLAQVLSEIEYPHDEEGLRRYMPLQAGEIPPGIRPDLKKRVTALAESYRAGITAFRNDIKGKPQPSLPAEYGLTEYDVYLFREGNHSRIYDKLGSHVTTVDGVRGTLFAVWAPNAASVSVIGDFNDWNKTSHPLSLRADGSGIWEGFVGGVVEGALYKYHIVSKFNNYRADKGDPYAFYWQVPSRTGTASVVWSLDYKWNDEEWMKTRAKANALNAPMSIYEVHPGSWQRVPEEGNRFLTYREMASKLVRHVKKTGFTHVEFMPVMEHPYYRSWGYQTVGYFAPTSRYGTPQDFMYLVDELHRNGIGVILDWVPAQFPSDEHGPAFFDGTYLYEHADPRQRVHPDWQSNIFNYGRRETQDFLVSSALFWLDKYHADGIRVDAVASMLYLDYSRKNGEWVPNKYGGNRNLEAIEFLHKLNSAVYRNYPDVQMFAEESTAWPDVSRPVYAGGLGFGLKWNMGWMHDTLDYLSKDPIYRKFFHNALTFGLLYAFAENFLLPISHDEVVYGKGSLINKMPGDEWQKFANLRLLMGYMYAYPGKKLLFMGSEFGQWNEWNHEASLDWHLLARPRHRGAQLWVRDLNRLYRSEPALHEKDFTSDGFRWGDFKDRDNSVISFARKSDNPKDTIFVVCNFTPVPRHNYRLALPSGGVWKEILNSDAREYGGSGMGNLGRVKAWQDRTASLTLPPLGILMFKREDDADMPPAPEAGPASPGAVSSAFAPLALIPMGLYMQMSWLITLGLALFAITYIYQMLPGLFAKKVLQTTGATVGRIPATWALFSVGNKESRMRSGAYNFYTNNPLLRKYQPENLEDTLKWLNEHRSQLGNNSLIYLVQGLAMAGRLPEGESSKKWVFSAGAYERAIKEEAVIRGEIERIWRGNIGKGRYRSDLTRLRVGFNPALLLGLKTGEPLSKSYRNTILGFAYDIYGRDMIEGLKGGVGATDMSFGEKPQLSPFFLWGTAGLSAVFTAILAYFGQGIIESQYFIGAWAAGIVVLSAVHELGHFLGHTMSRIMVHDRFTFKLPKLEIGLTSIKMISTSVSRRVHYATLVSGPLMSLAACGLSVYLFLDLQSSLLLIPAFISAIHAFADELALFKRPYQKISSWFRHSRRYPRYYATILPLKELVAPKMAPSKYAVWVAPWLEEGIFFALPMAIFNILGIDMSWLPLFMVLPRAIFLYFHEGARANAPPSQYIVPLAVASFGFALAFLPIALSTAIFLSIAFHMGMNIPAPLVRLAPATIGGKEDKAQVISALSPLAKDVLNDIMSGLMESAEKGDMDFAALRHYEDRRSEDDDKEGVAELVRAGILEISAAGKERERYRITKQGKDIFPAVWEENLVNWMSKMKTGDWSLRNKMASGLRDRQILDLPSPGDDVKTFKPERFKVLKDHFDDLADTLFSVMSDEIRHFIESDKVDDYEKNTLWHTNLHVIAIIRTAKHFNDHEMIDDLIKRVIALPLPENILINKEMEDFHRLLIITYPERGRALISYLMAYYSKYGFNIREKDKPIEGLIELLHDAGSESDYYFLRRIASYYLRDNSGQVNVPTQHALRKRTRKGTYDVDIEGVIRQSIHNDLGAYVIGRLERALEYFHNGNLKVLGDLKYPVDAFKDDEFPSMDKAFPQSVLDIREGFDVMNSKEHAIIAGVFRHLEGELGRQAGAKGDTKWEKLRWISDEGLQKIYDAVSDEMGFKDLSRLQHDNETYDFTGYIYAYRELCERYKRSDERGKLAGNLHTIIDNYSSVSSLTVGASQDWVFGPTENRYVNDIMFGEPLLALERIGDVKKAIREKIFKGGLEYDMAYVMDELQKLSGRDDDGNAEGGGWARDPALGLYMADFVLTMAEKLCIKELAGKFAPMDDSKFRDALTYLKTLGEISYAEGLIPRSFVDHVITLLTEKDIDAAMASDVLNFMNNELNSIENFLLKNVGNQITAMLETEDIRDTKKKNEEFTRRFEKIVGQDGVYSAARRMTRLLKEFLSDREGALPGAEKIAPIKREIVLFGDTVDTGTLLQAETYGRYGLSAKGLELVRAAKIGLPVPEGVIIPTTTSFYRIAEAEKEAVEMLGRHLSGLKGMEGIRFGDPENPLIVSVRSGAYFVMPGQLPSIVNVGLCRATIRGFIKQLVSKGLTESQAEWTAWDSYLRFLQTYGSDILDISKDLFRKAEDSVLARHALANRKGIDTVKMDEMARAFEAVIVKERGKDAMPQDAWEQLERCAEGVKASWGVSLRHRKNADIKGNWPGTAVIIQRMVFGNILRDDSGSGVVDSRRVTATRIDLNGDFLKSGQGEDIAQHRADQLERVEDVPDNAEWKKSLEKYASLMETSLGTLATIEFTVEMGRVYILQAKNALIEDTPPDYLFSLPRRDVLVDPERTIHVSGGAYRGMVYVLFEREIKEHEINDMYVRARKAGCDGIIAVADDITPGQIDQLVIRDGSGRLKVGAIMTKRGGKCSHAAELARQHQMKAALANVVDMNFVGLGISKNSFALGEEVINDGDILSISGATGVIYKGFLPLGIRDFVYEGKRLDKSFNYFVSRMTRRGQVLSAIDQLLELMIDKKDMKLLPYLNTIKEKHSAMLAKKAPYISELIEKLKRKTMGLDDVREWLMKTPRKNVAEGPSGVVTQEMKDVITNAIKNDEVLSRFNLSLGDIKEVVIEDERTIEPRNRSGRISINFGIKIDKETIPLVAVLYGHGFDLNPDLLSDEQTLASRLLDYLEQGILDKYGSRLDGTGISAKDVRDILNGADGNRGKAEAVLAEKIGGLSYEDVSQAVAGIGIRARETAVRRYRAMDDGIVMKEMYFAVLTGKGSYEGLKLRVEKQHPIVKATVEDVVLLGKKIDDRKLSIGELDTIRKDSVKVLLRLYDNRIDVYNTLARSFGLRKYDSSIGITDLLREIAKIDKSDINDAKSRLLKDLLGITEHKGLSNQIIKEFRRLGRVKRFPKEITLADLAIREKNGDNVVQLISWGDYTDKISENKVLECLNKDLKLPLGLVLESVEELYGKKDATRFFREAYRNEPAGTELSNALKARIEDVIIGLPAGASPAIEGSVKKMMGDDTAIRIERVENEERLREIVSARKMSAGIFLDGSVTAETLDGKALVDAVAAIKNNRFLGEHPQLVALNESNLNGKTKSELAAILKLIEEHLEAIRKGDIDEDLAGALETSGYGGIKTRGDLAGLVSEKAARRRAETACIYNQGFNETLALAEASVKTGKAIAMVTTGKVARLDAYIADDMKAAVEKGIVNCIVYGGEEGDKETFNTPEEAQAFLRANGYRGDLNRVVFVDKRSYPTYEALVKGIQDEIKARTGLDISSSNIGIRSMKGEVMREGEASTDARLLEIAEKNIKGKNVPILMNTYSVLLRMVTELPEGAPVEDIIAALGRMIPGLSYDKIKKVFSYLPPIVPEDYQSDYENNRRSAEFVLSAA